MHIYHHLAYIDLFSGRSAKRVKALNMLKDGKPRRNADGEITQAAAFQKREVPVARIEPNRKWFGNTRVISQDSLNSFRTAMEEKASDPYQVLLRTNKLPLSLIRDNSNVNGIKKHEAKMAIETAPFSETFGPKAQRKRVKLSASTLADLAEDAEKSMDNYQERREQARLLSGKSGEGDDEEGGESHVTMAIEPIFNKGQSKRIWNELYRVLDSSDVVIHVLDARDPLGTRCRSVEKYLREEAPHKHLIFVLNKTDLVPTSVAVSFFFIFIFYFSSSSFCIVASPPTSTHPQWYVRDPSAPPVPSLEGYPLHPGKIEAHLNARDPWIMGTMDSVLEFSSRDCTYPALS